MSAGSREVLDRLQDWWVQQEDQLTMVYMLGVVIMMALGLIFAFSVIGAVVYGVYLLVANGPGLLVPYVFVGVMSFCAGWLVRGVRR